MNVGLGLNVQFTLQEALEFLSRKVEHLSELFNVADREAVDKAKRVKDVRSHQRKLKSMLCCSQGSSSFSSLSSLSSFFLPTLYNGGPRDPL